jgi:hypothetical protein
VKRWHGIWDVIHRENLSMLASAILAGFEIQNCLPMLPVRAGHGQRNEYVQFSFGNYRAADLLV